jgi:hypothetical protein
MSSRQGRFLKCMVCYLTSPEPAPKGRKSHRVGILQNRSQMSSQQGKFVFPKLLPPGTRKTHRVRILFTDHKSRQGKFVRHMVCLTSPAPCSRARAQNPQNKNNGGRDIIKHHDNADFYSMGLLLRNQLPPRGAKAME